MLKRYPLLIALLVLGYAFLYLPIISLVVYSFNESRLVTVWGGFSTKWYVELFQNGPLLRAAGLSIKIAAINATIAVVLGTRSEEHTSELQSRPHLVCRLLLEKKKRKIKHP